MNENETPDSAAPAKTKIEQPAPPHHSIVEARSFAQAAKEVLQANDRGTHTVPAGDLYPHQWLWDSCFIAIGMRHYDVERAKIEILSLLSGQWSNGMVPHIIFDGANHYRPDQNAWRSWVSPYSPDDVKTSGITQPPMLAEAVVRIGEKLPIAERRSWYRMVWPALLAHHQWLYAERDPHHEGLVIQIHPWETGLDNTPPWMGLMHEHLLPLWIRLLKKTHADTALNLVRRDTRVVPAEQRFSNIDALALFSVQRRLRRKGYDIRKILDHSLFAIEDLTFNSVFIRANKHLREIAKSIREEIPEELDQSIKRTSKQLDALWDPYAQSYFSRDFVTHKLIKQPSIASLMPLYSGAISQERAEILVRGLENEHLFGPAYPVPSVPISSPWFNEQCYWQGPSWVNANWLIIQGLENYGFHKHAEALRESTLEMVSSGGFYEYFNPLNGTPLGSANFSWTAALAIDLLHKQP